MPEISLKDPVDAVLLRKQILTAAYQTSKKYETALYESDNHFVQFTLSLLSKGICIHFQPRCFASKQSEGRRRKGIAYNVHVCIHVCGVQLLNVVSCVVSDYAISTERRQHQKVADKR